LAWVGIGCGTIAIVAVIAMVMLLGMCRRWAADVKKNPEKATAEMIVRLTPGLEKVSSNDRTGELTFRDKKTGEVITMSYEDIKAGKITVRDAEGRTTQIGGEPDLSQVPSWVPRYPGAAAEGGVMQQKQGAKVDGVVNLTTTDAPAKVVAFFKETGGKSGLAVGTENTMTVEGQEIAQIELAGDGRKLTVNAVKPAGEPKTTVTLLYSEGGE